jgi:hypothetical protein
MGGLLFARAEADGLLLFLSSIPKVRSRLSALADAGALILDPPHPMQLDDMFSLRRPSSSRCADEERSEGGRDADGDGEKMLKEDAGVRGGNRFRVRQTLYCILEEGCGERDTGSPTRGRGLARRFDFLHPPVSSRMPRLSQKQRMTINLI